MLLSDEYWTCECEKNWIRSTLQNYCYKCKTPQYTQPNAKLVDILNHKFPEEFIKKLRKKFKENILNKISEEGLLGEEFIFKCFDDALIDVLLED